MSDKQCVRLAGVSHIMGVFLCLLGMNFLRFVNTGATPTFTTCTLSTLLFKLDKIK